MGQILKKQLKLSANFAAEIDSRGVIILRSLTTSIPVAISELEEIIAWHNTQTKSNKGSKAMSSERRNDMETTKKYLQGAEQQLQQAHEFAKKGGDGKIAEKITKIKQATQESREEINKKLNENG